MRSKKAWPTLLFLSTLLCIQVLFGAQSIPTFGRKGMVVSAEKEASRIGLALLKNGGNAVDAAVGTAFALAVTFPRAGNLGGGGFMTIALKSGPVYCLNFRERASGAAFQDMYLDEQGAVQTALSLEGAFSVAVPGTPAGLLAAHARFGKLPLKHVIAPAIRLASRGFKLSYDEARRLNQYRSQFEKFPGSKKVFVSEIGKWKMGDVLVQRDLARTLRHIRDKGLRGFYEGEVGKTLVEELRKYGGIITESDLTSYEAKWSEPLHTRYQGYDVYTPPLPSGGGLTLIQLLELVEPFDLHEMEPLNSDSLHIIAEAMKRAYEDRVRFMGDPDFVDVPVDKLISPDYLKERMRTFSPIRTEPVPPFAPIFQESAETTHLSVVDAEGNAVSCTTSLNGYYGSKFVVSDLGFFLNNQMNDFSLKVGFANKYGVMGSLANAIAPGKQMLSSMAPTVVLKDKKPYLVIGAPGGSIIPGAIFQVILNVLDFGMSIQTAVDFPRIHHQWLPDEVVFEKNFLPEDVRDVMEGMGWRFRPTRHLGQVNAILIDEVLQGGEDHRQDNKALGY